MNITIRRPKNHRTGGDAANIRKQLLEKRVRKAVRHVTRSVRDWAASRSASEEVA